MAVKEINKEVLQEKERIFLRNETQILQSISHPNIVKIKEQFESKKYLSILMEQVPGGELFHHI